MKKSKKEREKRSNYEIAVGKLLKDLIADFPDSMIDRIHILRDALMIQFKALSFTKCSPEKLEKYGKDQIDSIHKELHIFVDTLHLELMKMWEKDKEYRKAKE